MAYVPKTIPIFQPGNWTSGFPGIVAVNYDPSSADYANYVKNVADGTLFIQYAEPGEDCDQTCVAALFIKACSDCDTPVVGGLLNAAPTLAAADGALALPTQGGNKTVLITKGSAAALTLAAPTTVPDGTVLTVISTTAFAHTITQAAPGFNGGGGGSDVATFGAAAGNSITVVAYNGVWYVQNLTGVTLG